MPTFICSQRHYFRENGKTLLPGQEIELTEEQAALHNHNEPGLLKPALHTAQGSPAVVRAEVPTEAKPKRGKAKKAPVVS